MELQCFGDANIAISDASIASWLCFYCCSLQYDQNFIIYGAAKIELQKKWAKKIIVSLGLGLQALDARYSKIFF